MKEHNYSLDVMRFLAALMVTLFHLNQAIEPVDNWYRNIITYGWLGVPVFFVISGYCIVASAYNSGGAREFLIKRVFRIFPTYWISLLIVYLSAIIQKIYTGTNSVQGLPKTLTAIVANLTLTTAPFSKIETVNWVYWSLTCEVIFYLVIGLGLLVKKRHFPKLILIVSFIAAFTQRGNFGMLFFLNNWPAFGLGISLYFFYQKSNWQSVLSSGLLFLVNAYGIYHHFSAQPEYLIATFIIILSICLSKIFPIRRNFISKLGEQSYSVYLIHVPIGVFTIGLFEPEHVKVTPYLNLLYDISVFAIINIFAFIMFIGIEKPSMQYGKRLSKKSSTLFNKPTETL